MGLADLLKLGLRGFTPAEIKTFRDSGISTDEVIRLSENGYSAADINELITLGGTGEQVQPGNEEHTDPSGPADLSGNEGDPEESSYKKRLDDQEKEIEEQKKLLQKLQEKNSSRDLSGSGPHMTARDQVQEAFKNLY